MPSISPRCCARGIVEGVTIAWKCSATDGKFRVERGHVHDVSSTALEIHGILLGILCDFSCLRFPSLLQSSVSTRSRVIVALSGPCAAPSNLNHCSTMYYKMYYMSKSETMPVRTVDTISLKPFARAESTNQAST